MVLFHQRLYVIVGGGEFFGTKIYRDRILYNPVVVSRDCLCLLNRLNSVGVLSLRFVGFCQAKQRLDSFWVGLERKLVALLRSFVIVLCHVNVAHQRLEARAVAIDLNGLLGNVLGFLNPSLLKKKARVLNIGFLPARLVAQGRLELANGAVNVAGRLVCLRQVKVQDRMVGVNLESHLVGLDRRVVFLFLFVNRTHVVVSQNVVGVQSDYSFKTVDRVLKFFLELVSKAKVVVNLDFLGAGL